MKTILSIDQATSTTGYAMFKDDKLLKYGKMEFAGETIERISKARSWLESLTTAITFNKDLELEVVIEDIQYQPSYEKKVEGAVASVTTFKTLAQLQGVLLELLYSKGIKTHVYPAPVWRSTFGIKGKGRTEQKQNTQKKVKELFGIDVTQDEADAILLGYHLVKKNENEINWD